MGQATEAAISMQQGLPFGLLGVIAATVTLTMGLVTLMLNIFKTLKGAVYRAQETPYQQIKDNTQFQTKTVDALGRLIEMADSSLAQNREHNNNSRELTSVLQNLTDCMTKGFIQVSEQNTTIQKQLISQNENFAKLFEHISENKKA